MSEQEVSDKLSIKWRQQALLARTRFSAAKKACETLLRAGVVDGNLPASHCAQVISWMFEMELAQSAIVYWSMHACDRVAHETSMPFQEDLSLRFRCVDQQVDADFEQLRTSSFTVEQLADKLNAKVAEAANAS